MLLSALVAMSTAAYAVPAKPTLSTPTISCFSNNQTSITVQIKAGATGAPAGFSLQWIKTSDLLALGGVWPTAGFCAASFSGVPSCSNYNLAPNATVNIKVGDNLFDDCGASSGCANIPLECGTQYSFRAFAHANAANNKSAFSAIQVCETAACDKPSCEPGCTLTQGFWKTHSELWSNTSLTLGSVNYSAAQLLTIYNAAPAGNGLKTLAHQLITAKLNILNGAEPTAIQTAIASADALIGTLIVPPVGAGFLAPTVVATLVNELTDWNEGKTGPGHCAEGEEPTPTPTPEETPIG